MSGESIKPTEAELSASFSRFDADGDGLIDEVECLGILEALGDSPSREELALDFAAMDANSDGKVDFEEFKAWWLS